LPAIVDPKLRQVAAHQGTAQRAAAIDHEHPPLTRFLEGGAYHRVILEDLERVRGAMKSRDGAIVTKHRLGDLDLGVGVRKIGSGKL
jgi:hypothetical protein